MQGDKMYRAFYSGGFSGDWGWDLELNLKVPGFTGERDQLTDEQRSIIWQHCEAIRKELEMEAAKRDPKKLEQKQLWLSDYSKMFKEAGFEPIFVKEIPNEYCRDACCVHRVWALVTTNVGIFKIGPRKSVIHLEWTETTVSKTAEELFPNESTTKFDKAIHCAWGDSKVVEYLKVLAQAK